MKLTSGKISFTFVQNLQENVDNFHKEGINNFGKMISKEKGGMLNFWHPNYVEFLNCIVRRHRKPLSTVYIYLSNSVGWSTLPVDETFKEIAVTFHLTLNE